MFLDNSDFNMNSANKEDPFYINQEPWEVEIFSPGRINLIGEHTDYNQGYALPTAIDLGIQFKFRRNSDLDFCRIYSEDFKQLFEASVHHVSRSENQWENYILGVFNEFQHRNLPLNGFDCVVKSSIPIGAGLSSSAALVCGLAYGLNELFGFNLTKQDIVDIGYRAERYFVGVNCGIMDHTACVLSQINSFILLDCRSNSINYVPFIFDDIKIVLFNTNIKHQLTETDYNKRQEECNEAVRILQQQEANVQSLRDVSLEMLIKHKESLGELLYNRCLYVVSENQRVLLAVDSIQKNQLNDLGNLLYLSHDGLKNQYEVSCSELDFLVDFTIPFSEVYGSRMMGGGFGGCSLNLIQEDKLNNFVAKISKAYKSQFDLELSTYVVEPKQGIRTLKGKVVNA